MIEFKAVGDTMPKDIQVTTDDANAELVRMEDAFSELEELEAAANLSAAERENDKWTFIIPGAEAADVADAFEGQGIDGLWPILEGLNAAATEAKDDE